MIRKMSKHKIRGKHSLKHDSIFKGKKEDRKEEHHSCYIEDAGSSQMFEADVTSQYFFEKENPYEYRRITDLRNEIRDIIEYQFKIDLTTCRRRPNREAFNRNYEYLVRHLDKTKYSLAEIFVEFSIYFSENYSNMFKLLNNEWRDIITASLHVKSNNNEVQKIDEINFE